MTIFGDSQLWRFAFLLLIAVFSSASFGGGAGVLSASVTNALKLADILTGQRRATYMPDHSLIERLGDQLTLTAIPSSPYYTGPANSRFSLGISIDRTFPSDADLWRQVGIMESGHIDVPRLQISGKTSPDSSISGSFFRNLNGAVVSNLAGSTTVFKNTSGDLKVVASAGYTGIYGIDHLSLRAYNLDLAYQFTIGNCQLYAGLGKFFGDIRYHKDENFFSHDPDFFRRNLGLWYRFEYLAVGLHFQSTAAGNSTSFNSSFYW